MTKIVKDGASMVARDGNQLAAFLNNGWKIDESKQPAVQNDAPKQKEYSKSEINRMSTSDLQKLASESGVEGAESISGSELKKILIEKFGL